MLLMVICMLLSFSLSLLEHANALRPPTVHELRARLEAFALSRNRSMLILVTGDSLVDAQHKLLCLLLDDACHPSSSSSSLSPQSNSSIATPAHCKEAKHSTHAKEREWPMNCHSKRLNITAVMIGGGEYCKYSPPPSLSSLQQATNISLTSPFGQVIVYQGCGLRLLHLGPQRNFNFLDSEGLYDIFSLENNLHDSFARYRDHFTNRSSDLHTHNVSLISHLPHSICAQKFSHRYAVYAQLWNLGKSSRDRLSEECLKSHQQKSIDLEQHGRLDLTKGSREQQLKMVCDKAVLLDEGVQYLIGRIWGGIDKLGVKVVDGYQITKDHCDLTHDGRHYDSLVSVEVSSLFDQIDL